MYHLAPEVVARVGFGGGTDNYREFVEANTSAITHPAAQSITPARGISRTVPQRPARPGRPAPGTASWDLNPSDPSVAIRDIVAAAEAGATRFFQEDEGLTQEIHEETTSSNSTTVEVTTAGLITLAQKGTGSGREEAGTNLSPKPPWDRARILLVGSVALFLDDLDTGNASTIQGSYLGDVSGNVVTPETPGAPLSSAIVATDAWRIVEWAIRREFSGVMTEVPGHSTSADTRTSTVSVQLAAFATKTYLLPA